MFRVAVVVILAILWMGQSAFAQFTSCNGGANVGVRVKISNAPTTVSGATANTFAALPGASVTFSVPAGATRRFVVSFSGETRLIGNTSASNWIELQVRDNGNVMQPQDDTSPLAFASADVYESNAATFCRTVTNTTGLAVTHTISVWWRISGASNLTAWLDDWTLRLDVHN
jgi:hypothetical protein